MLPSVSLKHAILSYVYWTPMHGYKLRQMATRHSWIYPIKHSSIYPVLHDLEKKGLVTHHSDVHEGRARKIYSITDAGREELENWLVTAPEHDVMFSDTVAFKIAAHRDETVLRSKQWIETSIERLREKVAQYQAELATENSATPYSRLAVEYGIEMLRLRTKLLERVLETAESNLNPGSSELEPLSRHG